MALEVIGAGLGRTGTLSLKLALEELGFGPCYHMIEIFADPAKRLPQWNAVVDGSPDWDAIFAGYRSSTDYPVCTYWKELAEYYPDAKVVLSTREPEKWVASVHQTIMSPQGVEMQRASPFGHFLDGAIWSTFEHGIDNPDTMAEHFRQWEASVVAGLPPERLLVHTSADGWEPLCEFLDVPVPDAPYPRVNSKDDMMGFGGVGKVVGEPGSGTNGARSYLEQMRTKAFGA